MQGSLTVSGLSDQAVDRFITEQVSTLPGVAGRSKDISVFLTGSRALGIHGDHSDIDIELVCDQAVYNDIHKACFNAKLVTSRVSFFMRFPSTIAADYFGQKVGGVHLSLIPLERIERQLSNYEDVPMWIWQNAAMVIDPKMQVELVVNKYQKCPEDVLVRKIKYHWLKAGYWLVDVYPQQHKIGGDMIAATSALVNAMHEYMRLFLLVESRPYPYVKRLTKIASGTMLGRKFCGLFSQLTASILSGGRDEQEVWDRLDAAFRRLSCCDLSKDAMKLWEQCGHMMVAAGVNRDWVEADYDNVDELLTGQLGSFEL